MWRTTAVGSQRKPLDPLPKTFDLIFNLALASGPWKMWLTLDCFNIEVESVRTAPPQSVNSDA
ncbi:hypothetical protein Ct61P_04932 [Colletotrichum tofieldiae]|nr:hypothetical protein Ct61P_04932 [Colletotrichum tofieldiae]